MVTKWSLTSLQQLPHTSKAQPPSRGNKLQQWEPHIMRLSQVAESGSIRMVGAVVSLLNCLRRPKLKSIKSFTMDRWHLKSVKCSSRQIRPTKMEDVFHRKTITKVSRLGLLWRTEIWRLPKSQRLKCIILNMTTMTTFTTLTTKCNLQQELLWPRTIWVKQWPKSHQRLNHSSTPSSRSSLCSTTRPMSTTQLFPDAMK